MSAAVCPPLSAPAAALVAAAVACRRGERRLFDGLELAIAPGQLWWIRGANGRGKTSLLKLLTGLSEPERGEIRWDGRPLRAAGAEFRQRLLHIGHTNALKDDLTSLEALQFLARIHGRPSQPPALVAALQTLGIASRRDAPVRTLSQGQRRRVALARLALDLQHDGGPGLWVLDEPYDALDADAMAIVDRLLAAHARRGGSTVLTSHLPLNLRDPRPLQLQLDALSPPGSGRAVPA